jgi:hypothetical protein
MVLSRVGGCVLDAYAGVAQGSDDRPVPDASSSSNSALISQPRLSSVTQTEIARPSLRMDLLQDGVRPYVCTAVDSI